MAVGSPTSRTDRIRHWLPRGQTLDDEAFAERHRTVSILLGLHLPALLAFGLFMGEDLGHVAAEVALAGLLLGLAQLKAMPRRWQGILTSGGLVWCSAVAVHFSGGMIEAHFHFFVILGFIALYQDWAAFGWAIVFTALSHGLGSTIAPDLMFNHDAAIQQPWTWALIHAGMVLFAATGQVIGWRHAEMAQDRATTLNTQLIREQASRQASFSRIYVNLARRNQSLLHRQLQAIDQLEQGEEDPDTLRRLFTLDHLTTRIRRNGESLLVMAGEESPRRWSGPIPLADIARAAASEVEQFERVEVRIPADVEVMGGAVVDLTHLLAELIENATEYSAPGTAVVVGAYLTDEGATVSVEDRGIGMSAAELAEANTTLLSPPELDEEIVRQLGFQVVGRLAAKRGLAVHLRPTAGGGTTAVVDVPAELLAGIEAEELAPEPAPEPTAEPAASIPASGYEPPPQAVAATPAPVAMTPPAPEPVATAEPVSAPTAAIPPAASATPPAPASAPPPSSAPVETSGPAGPPMLFSAKTPLTATPPASVAPSPTPSPAPAAANGASGPLHEAAAAMPPPASPHAAAAGGETANGRHDGAGHGASDGAASGASGNGASGNGATGSLDDGSPLFDDLLALDAAAPAIDTSSNGAGALPKRVPSASLAPQLRDGPTPPPGNGAGPAANGGAPDAAAPAAPTDPTAAMSPPEARRALSAFQASTRAARAQTTTQEDER